MPVGTVGTAAGPEGASVGAGVGPAGVAVGPGGLVALPVGVGDAVVLPHAATTAITTAVSHQFLFVVKSLLLELVTT
jgi:hypothetical protein